MRVKKRTFTSIVICFLVLVLTSTTVYAASFKKVGMFGDRYSVLTGVDESYPDITTYPFNEKKASQVGFDLLYGGTKSLFRYHGEIPYSLKDSDDYSDFYVYRNENIGNNKRTWNPSKDEADVSEDSKDLHIKAMTQQPNDMMSFMSIVYWIFYFFEYLTRLPIWIISQVKTIDLNQIATWISKSGNLEKGIRGAFLISNDGKMSPFLMFGVIGFVFSIAWATKDIFRGQRSFVVVIKEVKWLVIACIFFGVSIYEGGANKLSTSGMNLASQLGNEMVLANDNSSKIFVTKTGNAKKDADTTQISLIAKKNIDIWIQTQFGVSPDQMDMNSKNFGSKYKTAISDVLKAKKGKKDKISTFEVSNGKEKYDNLGYFMYAVDSGVRPYDPLNKGIPVKGSSDGILLAIDFLNKAHEYAQKNNETNVTNNIDTIMRAMTNPDFGKGTVLKMVSMISNAFLLLCLIPVLLFLLLGESIVTIGPFFVPMLPTLYLFKKTRNTANDMVKIYGMAFIRYYVGMVFYALLILLNTMLAASGVIGMIFAAMLFAAIWKNISKILYIVNTIIQKNEPPVMRRVTNAVNNYHRRASNAFKRGSKRAGKRLGKSFSKDEEGNEGLGYKAVNTVRNKFKFNKIEQPETPDNGENPDSGPDGSGPDNKGSGANAPAVCPICGEELVAGVCPRGPHNNGGNVGAVGGGSKPRESSVQTSTPPENIGKAPRTKLPFGTIVPVQTEFKNPKDSEKPNSNNSKPKNKVRRNSLRDQGENIPDNSLRNKTNNGNDFKAPKPVLTPKVSENTPKKNELPTTSTSTPVPNVEKPQLDPNQKGLTDAERQKIRNNQRREQKRQQRLEKKERTGSGIAPTEKKGLKEQFYDQNKLK